MDIDGISDAFAHERRYFVDFFESHFVASAQRKKNRRKTMDLYCVERLHCSVMRSVFPSCFTHAEMCVSRSGKHASDFVGSSTYQSLTVNCFQQARD